MPQVTAHQHLKHPMNAGRAAFGEPHHSRRADARRAIRHKREPHHSGRADAQRAIRQKREPHHSGRADARRAIRHLPRRNRFAFRPTKHG